MDTTVLRWVLIILGLAIIAGIFLFGNPERKSKRNVSQKRRRNRKRASKPKASPTRQEPTLGGSPDPEPVDGVAEAGTSEAPQAELPMSDPEPPKPELPIDPPEKIVTIYLRARDNHRISGLDLLDSALKSGLIFAPQGVFHRVMNDETRPLFCMADISRPGLFDKDAWNTFETRGVTMFMTLPGPLPALGAWDAMLATARRLAELLHADLLDDKGEVFTRSKEGEIREELRGYEREKLPEQ